MSEVNYLPLIENMTWSYTRLTSYDSCPYSFYLKYIYHCKEEPQFYASYGSFMHKLLEMYYRGLMTREEMIDEFLTGFSNNVEGNRPKQNTVEKYIRLGAEYLRHFKPFKYEMVEVEKRLDFGILGHRFVGIVDYLGKDGNDLVIIDHKSRDLKPRSNRKNKTAKDRELDEMLKQLYIYAEAIRQEYGRLPTRLCFNCFKSGEFIEEPFDPFVYEETIQWAVNKIHEIETTEKFPPHVEYFFCNQLCGLKSDCIYA